MDILFIGLFVGMVVYFSFNAGAKSAFNRLGDMLVLTAEQSYDIGEEVGKLSTLAELGHITEEESSRRLEEFLARRNRLETKERF